MYFDLKQVSVGMTASATRTAFSDSNGVMYLGGYLTWDENQVGLYKSVNGGVTWTIINSTKTWEPKCGVGDGSGNIYLYFNDNTLKRSSDGGATWTTITKWLSTFDVGPGAAPITGSPPDSGSCMAFDGTAIYIAGGRWIWKSTTQGDTWTALYQLSASNPNYAGMAASPSLLLVASKTAPSVRSLDGGVTWESAPGFAAAGLDYRVGIYRTGHYFFGVGDGYIYEVLNNGDSLVRCSETAINGQAAWAPVNGNGLWFGSYAGAVYAACAVAPVFNHADMSILPDQVNVITATSQLAGSHIAITNDGSTPTLPGDITTLPAIGTSSVSAPLQYVKAIAAVEPDGIIDLLPSVVASARYQYRTSTPTFSPDTGSLNVGDTIGIADSSTGDVAIVYTLDGTSPDYTGETYNAKAEAGYGSVLNWRTVVTDTATGSSIFVSNNASSGTVWRSPSLAGSSAQLTTLGTSGAGNWLDAGLVSGGAGLFVLEVGSHLWYSPDTGATWSDVLLNATADQRNISPTRVFVDNRSGINAVIVTGTTGTIVSHDNGATWATVDLFAGQICGRVVRDESSTLVSAPLYVGTSAGLYKTLDLGTTWVLVSNQVISGVNALAVYGKHIAIHGSKDSVSGVYYSTDTGTTWAASAYLTGSDPQCFLFVPDSYAGFTPILYGTGGAGNGLTSSHDYGETWGVVSGPMAATPDLSYDSAGNVYGFDNVTYHFPFIYSRGYAGALYLSPVIAKDAGSLTLKAIARKKTSGYVNSDVKSSVYTVVATRTLFVGKDGVWHPVIAEFAGSGAVWKSTQISVGNNGAWR